MKSIFLIALIAMASNSFAQSVGIGTTSPAASAMLEVKSNNKGLLIPRTSSASRTAIASPAKGLMVYDTTTSSLWLHNGSSWVNVSVAAAGGAWNLTGNSGTNPAVNFVGTTDAQDLLFKVNNRQAGRIDNSTYDAGTRNTAFGLVALNSNTTGGENTAQGYGAMYSNQTGNNNVAIGKYSLYNNNGSDNTGLGFNTMFFNTSGSYNTATGSVALQNNFGGNYNTATGFAALYSDNGGAENTATGAVALISNISGNDNTATGYAALNQNNASYNSAHGANALYSNTTGTENTAMGYHALTSNSTGYSNIAIGAHALEFSPIQINNVAVGDSALRISGFGSPISGDGSANVAMGSKALMNNTTGNRNTSIGFISMVNNDDGVFNTAIGSGSLYNNTGGSFNTAIGVGALEYSFTETHNTALGYNANIGLGNNITNATAIGANTFVTASNKIRLGDANITAVESAAGSWTTSDGRFKNNIRDNVKGLEFIKLLKPVTYNFDTRKFTEFLMQNCPDSVKDKQLAAMDKAATAKASSIVQSGFVAQEVAEAARQSGYNYNGVHAPENPTDNWSLSYEKLVVPLVKAVQEQQAIIEEQNKKIALLLKEMHQVKDKLK